MARLEAPVMNTRRCAPAARASSTAYWISGLSTTGSISLGLALVAGRKRVPRPATGKTAVRIVDLKRVLIILSRAHWGPPPQVAPAGRSVRSAHLKTEGRMLSQERHFGQRQYQPTLWSPQSSHW